MFFENDKKRCQAELDEALSYGLLIPFVRLRVTLIFKLLAYLSLTA